jgi:hypothetical protein
MSQADTILPNNVTEALYWNSLKRQMEIKTIKLTMLED